MKYFLLYLLIFYSNPGTNSAEQNEPGLLPTTDDIFQMGKNLLGRYPFEMVNKSAHSPFFFPHFSSFNAFHKFTNKTF